MTKDQKIDKILTLCEELGIKVEVHHDSRMSKEAIGVEVWVNDEV